MTIAPTDPTDVPPLSSLLPLFRDLVLLRRGPQDLPYSPALMAVLVAGTLLLYAALSSHIALIGMPRLAFSLLLQLALTRLVLLAAGKPERFVQASIALLGAGIVLTLLAIPLLFAASGIPPEPKELTRAQLLVGVLTLLFRVWDIAVTGHILRHALDLRMSLGVLVAIVFYVIDQVAALLLFERPTG